MPQLRHEEGHGRHAQVHAEDLLHLRRSASLALAGIFPLAGFWSKDEILAGANGLGGDGGYKLMLVMGIIGAVLHRAPT